MAAESNNDILLKSFHKYGITKCDSFIIENSRLKGAWTFFVEQHTNNIDKEIKEVSIIQVSGSKNDTFKKDDSYIQTPKACYLHKKSTLTFPGSCSSNINFDYWYISNEMLNNDYNEYTNTSGAKLLAKEISVGNFKACIQEYTARYKYDIK
jgi:hypothetical protein